MHVYQRSIDGVNVFYDDEDYIVFLSIVSVLKKVYNVVVLEVCIMRNHVHLLLAAERLEDISAFVRHYTSLFVTESNHDIGRRGPLFHKSFGSAPKKGSKMMRSAIVYIGNNPVEKGMCEEARQYRWNFLAYADSMTPFSKYVSLKKCSHKFQVALAEVMDMLKRNCFLSYPQTRRLLQSVCGNERELLIDSIICAYKLCDYECLLSYYDNVAEMFFAMKSTSGSEYDIKERFYSGSDAVYDDMVRVVTDKLMIVPARAVIAVSVDDKIEIAHQLRRYTSASINQISRFLHLDISRSAECNKLVDKDEFLYDI